MLYQGANGPEWGIPPYLGSMPQLDYSQMKSLHALGITDLNDILEPGTYVGMSKFGGYPEIANVPDFAFGLDAFFLNAYKFVDPTDSSNVVLSQTLYPIVRSDNADAGAGELGGFYRQAFGHTSGAWLPWSKIMEAQHIAFTPTSTVASDNVQDAIEEVYTKTAPTHQTITLSSSAWSSNTQTVTVSGVTADELDQLITPTPAIASQSAYYEAGIMCTNQGTNSLTFTCQTVPTSNLTVYVVIQPLG